MAMPTLRSDVVLAPPPCHRLPCQISTLPLAISAGTESYRSERAGDAEARWDPGTTRVAPLASVKSVSAHIELHTVAGWGLGRGMIWSSAWIGCGDSPGPLAMEDREDTSSPGSSTRSQIGRTEGCTGICSKFGPWARRL